MLLDPVRGRHSHRNNGRPLVLWRGWWLQRGRSGLAIALLAATLLTTVPASAAHDRVAVGRIGTELAAGQAPAAAPAAGVFTNVRLTYYTVSGTMYSGRPTFEGAAAAHLGWLPIGTRFTLDCLPGHVYTVLDTGKMPPHWVDLYVRSHTTGRWLNGTCGDYVTVRVLDTATAPPPPAAEAPDPALAAALAAVIRAHLEQRGVAGIPPFAVEVLSRADEWVKVALEPLTPGVERAAVYLRLSPTGWQVAAGPGHAFDPDWLRALGVPDPLIVP